MAVFCGIDWAEGHHDIAVVDDEGKLVGKRRIEESLEGVAELTAMLAGTGDNAEDPIPVAIETPRGLLVAVLRAAGRPIHPINPLGVARYQERTSVSGKKSDHVDAMALANILRTDAHLHRTLPDDSAPARSVTMLARAYEDAVWRRTKLVQELRARLREYYPGFLAALPRRAGHRLDPACRDASGAGIDAVAASLRQLGGLGDREATLCHGVAGLVDVLAVGAQTFQDHPLMEAARGAAADLARPSAAELRSGVPGGEINPTLMVGSAGIGYQLLRIIDPAVVPSVLIASWDRRPVPILGRKEPVPVRVEG